MTTTTVRMFTKIALGGLLGIVLTGLAVAQKQPPQAAGPQIAELRIAIQDMKTKEQRGYVLPGQSLSLAVGDEVRLRMVAIPAERNRAPRYPSCRFAVVSGAGRVAMSNVKEEEGSALLKALRSDDPRDRRSKTVVHYELLEPMAVPAGLAEGTMTVDVEAPSQPEPEQPQEEPKTDSVTVYSELDYQGLSESFSAADSRLSNNGIGNDRIRSVRVPEGCEVILFVDDDYRGESALLTSDVPDLSRTRVGNDRVSSLQVNCGGGELEKGAVLYSELDFQGKQQRFTASTSSLDGSLIGNDAARSVRVAEGCSVTLYEDAFFRGESTVVTEDVADLDRTRVGRDRVSSIRVECR